MHQSSFLNIILYCPAGYHRHAQPGECRIARHIQAVGTQAWRNGNALLFTVIFIGMALGSALGSNIYTLAGWSGVVALATLCGAIALAIRVIESARVLSAQAESV